MPRTHDWRGKRWWGRRLWGAQPNMNKLRRGDDRQAFGTGVGPGARLLLDGLKEVPAGWPSIIENTRVAVLPDVPGREKNEEGQALPHGRGRRHGGISPPLVEDGVGVGKGYRGVAPSHNLVPHDAREGALNQEVLHSFIGLVAKKARVMMGKT